ncbi:MAG: hypothetical protein M9883_17685 [Methylobacteriaceae bacterium]|nr:hypothetical protein [Methylobacteriaceae bacterium]
MNDDLDMRAAEYVLGHQDSAEREAVRREMEENADLRAAVARWERRLFPLARTAQPAAPSPDLLARIKAGLPPRVKSDTVVVVLRRSLRRWRAAALVSGALAASVLVFAGARLFTDAGRPSGTFVAAVNRGGDAPALIVRVDMASGRVFVRPVSASPTLSSPPAARASRSRQGSPSGAQAISPLSPGHAPFDSDVGDLARRSSVTMGRPSS